MKIFLIFYIVFISCCSHALTNDNEYVVLFRGFHFCKGTMPVGLDRNLDHQTVLSPYVSSNNPSHTERQQLLSALQKLKSSGPYTTKTRPKKTFTSAYYGVQELYVNRYGNFIRDAQNANSPLRKLFEAHGVKFDRNIFVSTTLDAETAIKYAMGICIDGDHRNIPSWVKDSATHKPQEVGYLDVFFIPRADLQNLGAFPVVEEFALNNINLPYRCVRRDYTVAEEYNFPLEIDGRYHRLRLPITLEKKRKAPIKDEIEFARRQINGMLRRLNSKLQSLQAQEHGKRVFLYLLRHRMDNHETRLSPELAKVVHVQTQDLIIKTRRELRANSRSFHNALTLPVSAAIERTLELSPTKGFSVRCSDNINLNVYHLAALVSHENLSTVLIGEELEDSEIYLQCLGFGKSFMYDDMPEELVIVLKAAKQRKKPIIFKIDLLVERKLREAFYKIEKQSHNMIQFKFNRRKHEVAEEAVDLDYELGLGEDYNATIDPTRHALDQLVEHYVDNIESMFENAHITLLKILRKTLFRHTTKEELERIIRHFNSYSYYMDDRDTDSLEVNRRDTRSDVLEMIRVDFKERISKFEQELENGFDDLSFSEDDGTDEEYLDDSDSDQAVEYTENDEDKDERKKKIEDCIGTAISKIVKELQQKKKEVLDKIEQQSDQFGLTDEANSDLEGHGYSNSDTDDDDFDDSDANSLDSDDEEEASAQYQTPYLVHSYPSGDVTLSRKRTLDDLIPVKRIHA